MEKIIERCPECGNYTEGVPTYSTERKIVQKTTSTITTKIIGALIGFLIGLLFGGIGAIPGMIIGMFVSTFISPKTTETIDQAIYKDTKLTFTCLGCGNTWYKIIKNGTSSLVPDEVLQKEKDEIVTSYNKKASDHVWRIVMACLLFVVGLVMCMNSDTYTEGLWGIQAYSNSYMFSWVLMVISFPGVVYEFLAYASNKSKANQYEQMSLSDFAKTK